MIPTSLSGISVGVEGPVQIAYAVDDVAAAAEAWVARGAGPFFVREHIAVNNVRLRGQQPAVFDHSSAYGQAGDVMVELICDHAPPETRLGPNRGLHHLAFFVDDFAAAQRALEQSDRPEVLYAEAGTTPFAMHEDKDLGHLIEVYVGSPGLRDFYEMVRRAASESNPGERGVHRL